MGSVHPTTPNRFRVLWTQPSFGEAEEVLPEIMEILIDGNGRGRERVLSDLARLEGIYVPSGYESVPVEESELEALRPLPGFPERVKKRAVRDLEHCRALFLGS